MGAQTDSGHWNNSYHILYSFSIGNQNYLFGHNLDTKYWFIQELLPGGKMGSETDQGHWSNPYTAQFPFTIGGTQYIYGQDVRIPVELSKADQDQSMAQAGFLGLVSAAAYAVQTKPSQPTRR
jgi:hypothetical protein